MSPGSLIERLSAASGRDVSRETFQQVEQYVALLKAGAAEQNLISPSTLETIWERHVLDSAQLFRFTPGPGAAWADIGSGAGLPGLIIAILADGPMALIEPRRLRAEFLRSTVDRLGLAGRVTVHASRAERVEGRFHVITARAVAALDRLFAMAIHLSGNETTWVLPKGRNAQSELAQARRNWHCEARMERSLTDPASGVLVLTRVGKKK